MKTGTALVTTLFALASFPLLAQQPPPANPPDSPATTQQNPQATEPAAQSQAASPEMPAVEMSPVKGELVSKLDTKTAKTGDSVVVQTKAEAKTADGTEIPKGSKLVGRVMGVQASASGENSQVALQFDHLELKGGQNLPVHSQIQSISPAGTASAGGAGAMSGASAGGSPSPSPSPNGSAANGGSGASSMPQSPRGDAGAAAGGDAGPAAGTIVAKTGNIAIRTTSIPGVLLANNAPGQQDPRMAQTSSILLGAKQDVQLAGGTQMVVGVSAAAGGTQ